MKLMRMMAVVGLVHFALWWLTYFILLMLDFDVLGPSRSPAALNAIYRLNQCLMFPLLVEPVRRFMEHWPLLPGVAIASCIWAGCLSVAISAYQRRPHAYAVRQKI